MPDETVQVFRGKDTCIQRLYATATRKPFGPGHRVSLGAMLGNPNLTRSGKLEFSMAAMLQAANRLVELGDLEYDGQKAGRSGTANRMYKVITDFDSRRMPAGTVRNGPSNGDTPAETPLFKSVGELPATAQTAPEYELRLIELETRFDALVKQLGSISA